MFSVLVIRLRSLRLLRVSGIVMRLRMFLLLITFLKASHSFRNRLLVICKNAYLFATMIMTSVSSPFSCCRDRKSGSAGMPRPISYAVFCLKKISFTFIFSYVPATTEIYTLSLHDAFRSIAEGQWYRYAPSYVSPAYHLLEGFPFIQEPPSGDLQERVLIRHHDYDQCFQSVQLLQ